MKFPEIVEKLFETPEGHEAKVILIGATDQVNFEQIWSKHSIEEYTSDMDEKASKLGLSYTPVIIVVNAGKDGHVHANISLPTQKWVAELNIEDSIEESHDLQRITDWLGGFMEMFTMHGSVSGVMLDSGNVILGDPKNSLFKIDNIMKDLTPKQARSDLMTADLDIGTVDEIMAGQMSAKEIEEMNPVEKAVEDTMGETREALSALYPNLAGIVMGKKAKVEVKDESPVETVVPLLITETEEEKMRRTQEEVVAKYGYAALKDLVSRTKQPLLVKKPKA